MINNVVLMGRICNDIELKTTASNLAVTIFTVAIDRKYQKQGEEKQTDFLTVVAWKHNAEFIARYFKKGSMIALQGSIQTRNYEDKQGNKRTAFEVVADNVSFCGSKAESGTQNDFPPIANTAKPAAKVEFEEIDDDDDDTLPF